MTELIPIKIAEGFSNIVYTDTTGNRTVCWGHKILPEDESLIDSNGEVSQDTCDLFYEKDYNIAVDGASSLIPEFYSQPEAVQDILIDMCFNLGKVGLSEFTTFLGLIRECKYREAGDDLVSTRWYSQVGERAKNIVAVLEEIQ